MKRIFILGILLALLLNITGCAKEAKGKSDSQDNSKEIVIRYPNTQWYDAVYIADAKGLFAEQNIKIQYAGELPAPQIVPAVASGAIDFGLRHTPLIAIARAQGTPLKIVAAGTQTLSDHPHMRYIVRKDSGIESIKDIAGKKVAINSFGACSEFVTKEFLRINNVKGSVNFVVLPDAQQEQALEQGLIDVAIVHAPYSQKAARNPELKELINDYALDEGISGMAPYFTSEDFAKKNPEAVKGFVAAVAKASDWARDNEEEAKQIIADRLKIDVENVEPWAYYEHQLIDKDAVDWWMDFLVRDGELKPGQVKTEDLYTNGFNPYK